MKSINYKSYLLVILLVTLASSGLDRVALGLLLQDIKVDLHLSDTQLGLLSGIAFALFYSVMGIPIARWADRGNRVTIISLTLALWSAMVALCGVATSFVQLLLIRVGVAVGEAGCIPPANSLIADHFTRAERPRAVAIYMLGAPLSIVLGYLLAGWLNEFYGWRATFIMLGSPGLLLAVLAWFTLREPRCMKATMGAPWMDAASSPAQLQGTLSPGPAPSVKEVCSALWSNNTFRHLVFGFSVGCFFSAGVGQWQPAFFIRSFGLQTGELGTWFALINGLGAMIGVYLGGELASRYAAGNERVQLKATAISLTGFGLLSFLTYLSPNRYVAFGLMGVTAVGVSTISGPLFATIQTLVPERMRAVAIATLYLFSNLIGSGLGPLAAGALSDALRAWAGVESLRYALLILCPGFFWAGWHMLRASGTVTSDVAEVLASDADIVRSNSMSRAFLSQ